MAILDNIDTFIIYFTVFGRNALLATWFGIMLIHTFYLRYTGSEKVIFGLIPFCSIVYYDEYYVNKVLCVFTTLFTLLFCYLPNLVTFILFYVFISIRSMKFAQGAMPERNAIVCGWVPLARTWFELQDGFTAFREEREALLEEVEEEEVMEQPKQKAAPKKQQSSKSPSKANTATRQAGKSTQAKKPVTKNSSGTTKPPAKRKVEQ